ncbi:DUF5305 family protein [Halorubellus sp. JP-L1]|uniref:DUF5305 family protein n=1 Tax=Halorubellus sp. JP-L1 TaxID=2715753 RepID=UPI001F04774D|nr:DUF5305 family protein [Halorubellus sp. JP-L1]
MESYSWLRFKHAVATNTRAIVVACIVVALLSTTMLATGFVTDASALSPLADDDEEALSFHAASVEQHATVTVRNDTDAYDAGETLRDTSLYPRSNASDPTVTAAASIDHGRLESLNVTVTYTATRSTDSGDAFYTKDVVIAVADKPGSQANVSADLPIEDVFATRDDLEAEFGNGVSVSVSIATAATYSYEPATGGTVTRTIETGGAVEPIGNLYALPTGSERATHRPGAPADASGGMSQFLNWLALVALLSSLAFGVATTVGNRNIDANAVAREIQWQRFRDWVTEVESYTPQGDVNTVEVTNLNDLVNLAIDTNQRVLFHRPVEEYIVVDDDVMYKFTPDVGEDAGSTELFGLRKEDLEETEFPNSETFTASDSTDRPGE